jgi:2-polyprenyl-3-methyl-5-hydroxy-6-metoxy-1,4-benzoquinol methylase
MNNNKVNTETLNNCPLCGSNQIKFWTKGYDQLYLTSKQIFTYSKCCNCEVIFISERPLESEIYKFYPSDYGPYHGLNSVEGNLKENKSTHRLRKIFARISSPFNKLIRKVSPEKFSEKFSQYYLPPVTGALVLDFGCGSDKFLNHARTLGWNTIGMDFTEQPLEMAKKSGHKTILFSDASAWDLIPDASLDFVRLNHVLEHLYEPKKILSQLNKKMKKGARIHIAVPNTDSISAMLFKNKWLGLDCPRHIMLHNPHCLRNLLTELNFTVIEILQEPVTKDIARSYGFYKFEHGRIAHEEIGKLADDHKLAEIFYIPIRIASLLKKADRIHAFATK